MQLSSFYVPCGVPHFSFVHGRAWERTANMHLWESILQGTGDTKVLKSLYTYDVTRAVEAL